MKCFFSRLLYVTSSKWILLPIGLISTSAGSCIARLPRTPVVGLVAPGIDPLPGADVGAHAAGHGAWDGAPGGPDCRIASIFKVTLTTLSNHSKQQPAVLILCGTYTYKHHKNVQKQQHYQQ